MHWKKRGNVITTNQIFAPCSQKISHRLFHVEPKMDDSQSDVHMHDAGCITVTAAINSNLQPRNVHQNLRCMWTPDYICRNVLNWHRINPVVSSTVGASFVIFIYRLWWKFRCGRLQTEMTMQLLFFLSRFDYFYFCWVSPYVQWNLRVVMWRSSRSNFDNVRTSIFFSIFEFVECFRAVFSECGFIE